MANDDEAKIKWSDESSFCMRDTPHSEHLFGNVI